MTALVSIITPVYNASANIDDCIASVLAQSHTDWEMLLVDDCSTDDSHARLQAWAEKDSRLRVYQTPTNSGAAAARNLAIEQSSGRFIAFLDSDDSWYPEKLKRQLDFMQTHSYSLSCTWYKAIGDGRLSGKTIKAPAKISYADMLHTNLMGCLTTVYDTAVFGKRYFPDIPLRQDYALWLELLRDTDAYCVEEVLATYRQQAGSLSSGKFRASYWNWYVLRKQEGLSVFSATRYFLSYIWRSLVKYR